MQESDVTQLEQALAVPDPDPETLPEIPLDYPLATDTASRILRAAIKLEDQTAVLEERMRNDMAAWSAMISKQTDRAMAWRIMVKDWMLRNDVTQLKTPWFTASIAKGRTKIVVDDEEGTLARLKVIKATSAIKTTESIVKKEFDCIFNAQPNLFKELKDESGKLVHSQVAHDETGEPSLTIRRVK